MNLERREALNDAQRALAGERPSAESLDALISSLEQIDPALIETETQLARARLLELSGRNDEARHAFERIILLDPSDGEAQFALGVHLSDAGDVERAIRHWSLVPSDCAVYEDACYNLGQAAYNAGRFADALEAWQRLLVSDASDLQVQRKVVQALHALGRHDAADTAFLSLRAQWLSQRGNEGANPPEYVVVDQFVVRQLTVLVKAQISAYRDDVFVPVAFVVHATPTAPPLFAIELAASARGAVAEHPFVLQFHGPQETRTIGPTWREQPRYEALRDAAREAVVGAWKHIAPSPRRSES